MAHCFRYALPGGREQLQVTIVDSSIWSILTFSSSDQSLGHFVLKIEGHCHQTQLAQVSYIFQARQRGWGCHFSFDLVLGIENDAALSLIYVFCFRFGARVVIYKTMPRLCCSLT